MEYRCPKHDKVFEAVTDTRRPGAINRRPTDPNNQNAGFTDEHVHPIDGHPDCPLCQRDAREQEDDPNVRRASANAQEFIRENPNVPVVNVPRVENVGRTRTANLPLEEIPAERRDPKASVPAGQSLEEALQNL